MFEGKLTSHVRGTQTNVMQLTEYLGVRTILRDPSMDSEERLKHIQSFDTRNDPAILVSRNLPINIHSLISLDG